MRITELFIEFHVHLLHISKNVLYNRPISTQFCIVMFLLNTVTFFCLIPSLYWFFWSYTITLLYKLTGSEVTKKHIVNINYTIDDNPVVMFVYLIKWNISERTIQLDLNTTYVIFCLVFLKIFITKPTPHVSYS